MFSGKCRRIIKKYSAGFSLIDRPINCNRMFNHAPDLFSSHQVFLTLKVPVSTIDALEHF